MQLERDPDAFAKWLRELGKYHAAMFIAGRVVAVTSIEKRVVVVVAVRKMRSSVTVGSTPLKTHLHALYMH